MTSVAENQSNIQSSRWLVDGVVFPDGREPADGLGFLAGPKRTYANTLAAIDAMNPGPYPEYDILQDPDHWCARHLMHKIQRRFGFYPRKKHVLGVLWGRSIEAMALQEGWKQ